jgi:hypothetical protein
MALDSTGRPIPVHTPDPPNHQPRTGAEEQFLLATKKTDATLQELEDLARRVLVLEQAVEERLNARLLDFERRFDEMMLERLREFERRFDMKAEAARTRPEPPPAPALPAPSE